MRRVTARWALRTGAWIIFVFLGTRGFVFSQDIPRIGEVVAQTIDSEFDRYMRQAGVLKRRHDSGKFDDRAMLKVLRSAGVFESIPPSGISGVQSFQTGFRPFKVRVYNGLWRWPLRAGIVSSEYGRRWGRPHEGIDIAADRGVPVMASANGTVLYAGSRLRGYGNVVILRHDQRTTSLYAHNDRILVRTGDSVRAGQMIAVLGSTGRSTGPHVHFEIRRAGKPLNPRFLLVKSRF